MILNKALGQNFFNNPGLADWIAGRVYEENPSSIIEIGPGDGFFTKRLFKISKCMVLLEKDSDLVQFLSRKFPTVTIQNIDVLDYNLNNLKTMEKPIVVYGSLPYNISKRIISKFSKSEDISSMYFIIQREVADKYIEKSGKSSMLSIFHKIYCDTDVLKYIKPGNFTPAPKVDSALVRMKRNTNINGIDDLTKFESLIKAAFQNPRKTLNNNLKGAYKLSPNSKYFSMRPETLKFEDYRQIYKELVL